MNLQATLLPITDLMQVAGFAVLFYDAGMDGYGAVFGNGMKLSGCGQGASFGRCAPHFAPTTREVWGTRLETRMQKDSE